MSRTLAAAVAAGLLAIAPATALAAPSAEAEKDAEAAKLEREADKVAGAVEAIRGLKFVAPVKKGVESREELRRFVVAELEKEMPDEKIRALEKAYVKIGFLRPHFDLKKTLIDLYSEQIAGFYNPERKELFLVEQGGPEQGMLMAHELTHALQDQHFDLFRLQKAIVDNDDRSLALTGVIEGDATIVMLAYVLEEQGVKWVDVKSLPDIGTILKISGKLGELFGVGGDVIRNAPKVLTENLMFGYVEGASFCQRAIKGGSGGFKAVSALFKDLPASSEQILHPEKYQGGGRRDEPIEVVLPDLASALGSGWKLLVKNVMGEFNTALLFKEKIAAWRSDRAGEGWGGDAWQALEGPEGQVVLAWYTVWDTPGDAEEFESAYRDFAERRGDAARFELDRHGTTVTVIDGYRSFETVERLRAAFGRVETRRGYGPLVAVPGAPEGASPFASLEVPDGFSKFEPGDAAVKRAYRGPGGVELRLIESPAAARSSPAAARLAWDEIRKSGSVDGSLGEDRVTVAGRPAAELRYTDGGTQHLQIYVVSGDRLEVLALSGSPAAVRAARRALLAANPALIVRERPGRPVRPPERAREPTLY